MNDHSKILIDSLVSFTELIDEKNDEIDLYREREKDMKEKIRNLEEQIQIFNLMPKV